MDMWDGGWGEGDGVSASVSWKRDRWWSIETRVRLRVLALSVDRSTKRTLVRTPVHCTWGDSAVAKGDGVVVVVVDADAVPVTGGGTRCLIRLV